MHKLAQTEYAVFGGYISGILCNELNMVKAESRMLLIRWKHTIYLQIFYMQIWGV